MFFSKYMRGVIEDMLKEQTIRSNKNASSSIIGKRKLDYSYTGFISSTARPPLSSPKLEENSGVNKNVKAEK